MRCTVCQFHVPIWFSMTSIIGLIGITYHLPTCVLTSPLFVIWRLGVCILSALNWYPPKTPNPPKSLWTINSSQGYDSFPLLRIQTCFLSILDKPSVWGCFHPIYRSLILSWKTRTPFVFLLSVHSVLGEAANKSPVGDRRWSLQTTSHPPHHPCHDGHTLNLSLRLNLVVCLVTTTWKAIEHCPMAHLRLASLIFHYKFK